MSAALTALRDGVKSLGVQDSIPKPFDTDSLIDMIACLVVGTRSARGV
jgi:hypothetical protein